MKKLFLIFVVIFSLGLFSELYLQETVNYNENMQSIEKKLGMDFNLLLDYFEANDTYQMLADTAKQLNLNLIRPVSRCTYDPEKKEENMEMFKYIFLANNKSRYFDYFKIISGKKFDTQNANNNDLYMSTKRLRSQDQIAVLKKFLGSKDITIAPLAESYNYLTINGKYFIETKDQTKYDEFLDLFAKKLNDKYGKYGYHFEGKDFAHKETSYVQHCYRDYSVVYQGIVILLITVILMCYYIFNEAKKIATLKLNGYSNVKILLKMIFAPITKTFLCCNFFICIVSLILGNLNFCLLSVIYQAIAYLILLIFSCGTYFYIANIKLSTAIKNKKHTQAIWLLNIFVKAVCCTQAIIMILQILNVYDDIDRQKILIENWRSTNDYGVFYRVFGNDPPEDFREFRGEFYINSDKLYLYLNKLGALYINASSYDKDVVEHNVMNNKYLDIRANVNYLNRFPVYDTNGNKVNISEEDTDYILLVPEKFKSQEKDLKDRFFLRNLKEYDCLDGGFIRITEHAGIPVPDEIKNQKLKIIWLKNNQWIFSMNSDVFPSEGNMIKEPIIQVITEKNSHLTIREIDVDYGENVPLKVKLINQDPKLTYKTILPELKRLHLDDNYVHLTSLNEKLVEKISDYKDIIWYCEKHLAFNLSVLFILMVQTAFILFDKDKLKLIVRRLHGFGFWRSYCGYGLLCIFNVVFQILIYYLWIPLVNFVNGILHYAQYEIDLRAIYFIILLSAIEFLLSVMILKAVENKNKTKILKGGI